MVLGNDTTLDAALHEVTRIQRVLGEDSHYHPKVYKQGTFFRVAVGPFIGSEEAGGAVKRLTSSFDDRVPYSRPFSLWCPSPTEAGNRDQKHWICF